jgi:hypothetical protein
MSMTTHTIRQSTIFISEGRSTEVYSSIDEVPAELRRRLLESTSGLNSATIVIADRAGREQIVRALKGMPSDVRPRMVAKRFPWTEAFERKHDAPIPPAPTFTERAMNSVDWAKAHWVELALPAAVMIVLGYILARV